MDVRLAVDDLEAPTAMRFVAGGVVLAAPITQNIKVSKRNLTADGWEVYTTESKPPQSVLLRVDATQPPETSP